MASQSTGSTVAMTDMGFANEIGTGRLRWRAVQESLKGAITSPAGSNITAVSVSSDSEWLAYGRRGAGVCILKTRNASRAEITLPSSGSGLAAVVSAIYVHSTGSGKSASYALYAGDQQGTLVSWHFKDENSSIANPQVIATELGGITAICAHADGLFVAVKDGTKIVRVAIATGRAQDDFPQCSSPPICGINVATHLNSIIATTQHRHLTLYNLDRESSTPNTYLAGEGASVLVDVCPHLFEQEYQHILGVSELGEVSIWKLSKSAPSSKKPVAPSTRVKLDSTATKGHIILGAAFSRTKRGTIVVCYGTSAKPVFTELTYMEENTGSFHAKLTISSTERNTMLDNASSAVNGKKDAADAKGRVTGVMDAPIAQSSFKAANDALMQVDSAHNYPEDASEIPFAQLVKQQSKSGSSKLNSAANGSSSSNTAASGDASSASDMPRATSAVAALVAALSTNDRAQLGLILAKNDTQFVTSTLRQLPVSQVLPLLSELLSSFSSKASIPVINWTRNLLIIHQSYLASAPELINKLSGLYNTVDERLKNFPDLLKLSGRFDLLLAHLRDNDSSSETHGKRALQSYVEEDDDLGPESDDEDEMGSDTEGSENDFEDDGSDLDDEEETSDSDE